METNKKIITAIAVIMMISLSMAAVVTYLSNTVETKVTVDSPLTLQVSNGNGWEAGPVTVSDAYGGETFTYYQQVTNNNRQVEINTDMVTTIINTKGDVTCADFTKMLVTVTRNTHDTNEVGTNFDALALNLCTDTGGVATVVIPSNYQANEIEEYQLNTTFAVGVGTDTYTISTQAMV